jgi:hypothetical protein
MALQTSLAYKPPQENEIGNAVTLAARAYLMLSTASASSVVGALERGGDET